jgi:hypothetical protein
MRLSSLSRKLKLKPSELELFYENKGIKFLASSNSKLSDAQMKIALDHYGYEKEEVVAEVPSDPPSQPSEHSPLDSKDLEVESIPKEALNLNIDLEEVKLEDVEIIEVKEKVKTSVADDLTDNIDENIEVIKAPVIKLKGLTVKGKIELSTEKPKEKSQTTTKQSSSISHKSISKNITSNTFNPLEEARKKKAKKERELRKQRANQLKKEKRARYLNANPPRIEPIKKKLNKKPKKEPTVKVPQIPIKRLNRPIATPKVNRNLFQRIWRWLNTY